MSNIKILQCDLVEDLALADIGREFQIGHSDVRQIVYLSFSRTMIKFSINKTKVFVPRNLAMWFGEIMTIVLKKDIYEKCLK